MIAPVLDDGLSVAELVSAFTSSDLLEVNRETSRVFEGLVLGQVVRIVEQRLSLCTAEVARISGLSRTTLWRARHGYPIKPRQAMLITLALAAALEERLPVTH